MLILVPEIFISSYIIKLYGILGAFFKKVLHEKSPVTPWHSKHYGGLGGRAGTCLKKRFFGGQARIRLIVFNKLFLLALMVTNPDVRGLSMDVDEHGHQLAVQIFKKRPDHLALRRGA